jgi:hypothetical protein
MRRLVLLSALALGVTGCGDSPQVVLRDMMTFRTELADQALRVTDDASAKELREHRLKTMKERQEWIKGRLDKLKDDKKKLKEFFDVLPDSTPEMDASGAYVERAVSWLQTVGGEAASIGPEIDNMAKFNLPNPPPPPKQNSSGG